MGRAQSVGAGIRQRQPAGEGGVMADKPDESSRKSDKDRYAYDRT